MFSGKINTLVKLKNFEDYPECNGNEAQEEETLRLDMHYTHRDTHNANCAKPAAVIAENRKPGSYYLGHLNFRQ